MRAALLSLSLLTLLAPSAAAQVDKEALRKAAQLPTVSVTFNFGIDPVRGWVVGFGKPDASADIKAVRAQMKGDASDAERYFRLGTLLSEKKDWTAALTKAKQLYRQRLAMKPDDGYLLCRLGMTLWELDENKEAEELVRQAVQKAPGDWRSWSALGDLLDGKSYEKAEEAELHVRATCNLGLAVLLLRRGDPAALKQAAAQLDRVEKLLEKTPGSELHQDCETTRAILIALQGDPERARTRLRKVLEADEEHSGAKKALKILAP